MRSTATPLARPALLLALLIPLLTACGATPPDPGVISYDSAGVTITVSTQPRWGPGEFWTISSEPTLSIGLLDGPEEYQFTTIADAWRLTDGRVVIADRAAGQIRIFDATGTFLRAWGREGEGPGEFRYLSRVLPYPGDSIVAWDTRLRRLSVFDTAGVLGRTQGVDLEMIVGGEGAHSYGLAGYLWGAFADRSLAFVPMKLLRYEVGEELVFTRPVVRVSAEGAVIEVGATGEGAPERVGLRSVPAGEMARAAVAPQVVDEIGELKNPFPRVGVLATAADRLYTASGEGYEVAVWTLGGELDRIMRLEGASSPVDDGARRAYIEYYRDQQERIFNRPAAEVERDLAELRFPESLPPYSTLMVDDAGHLWVEEYHAHFDTRPSTWRVLSPDGEWLGSVRLPPRFSLREIGTDHLLGIRIDELGVPVVEVYRLER